LIGVEDGGVQRLLRTIKLRDQVKLP
jgi:hypothetical protein